MDERCGTRGNQIQQNIEQSERGAVGQETEDLSQRSASRTGLLAALIVLVGQLVMFAHWPSLSAQALMFDDEQYLTENYLVQNPSWESAGRFLAEVSKPSTVRGYYQPLAMISLMVDYALGGRIENLVPFHRTSLALHVMNTILVAVFVYLLFGQALAAAVVGLLFGVHPLTVEPIPWVAERKTLLAAFLALWCLIFYVCYAKRSSWKLYGTSVLMYVLALMAKPTSIPLPLLMLLLDYWPLRRLSKKTILEKMPFFVIGAIFGVLIFISQSGTFGVRTPGKYGMGRIVLILCHNIVFYLYKFIWPVRLSPFYPFPVPFTLKNPMVLAGVIGTCLLILALLISLRWTRSLLVGWLFFFVAIFPTMGVIGFHDMIAADRHAYLPLIGIMLVLAWFLGQFLHAATSISSRRIQQVGTLAVIVIVALLEALATRRYLACWKDTESIHQRMLAVAPHEPIVHNSLAVALSEQGRFDEAVIHYTEALRHKTSIAKALGLKVGIASKVHFNLANTLRQLGRLDDAVIHYEMASRIRPGQAHVHNNLARTLAELGKLDEAIAHHTEAIRLKPDYARAYCYRGIAFAMQSKLNEAVADFNQAIRIKPNYVVAHKNLGVALFNQGKFDQAIEQFRRALSIGPRDAETYCNLGIVLQSDGKLEEGISHFRQSLEIMPDNPEAHCNLGKALAMKGQPDEALKHFREAFRLKPNWPAPLNHMAQILATHPDPKIRDSSEAIVLAERAAQLTEYQNASVLDTLAAAYAAAGRFEQAVTTAEAALELASAAKADELVISIRKQLQLYRQAKP